MGDVGARFTEDFSAAIGREDFDQLALNGVASVMGTERVAWVRHVPGRGATDLLTPSLSASQHEDYARDYAPLNPYVSYTARMAPGALMRTSHAMDMRSYRRTPYFGWADRTFGIYELGVVVSRHDGGSLIVSLGRHRSKGDFTEAQVERFRALIPRLRRAYFLHTRVAVNANLGESFRNVLAHVESSHACFALSAQGQLLEANAAGEAELLRSGILVEGVNRLGFRVPSIDRAFSRAIAAGQDTAVLSLRAVATDGGDALLVKVQGLEAHGSGRETRWLLFVPISQSVQLYMRVADCAERWALTAMERRVLEQLALGSDLAEIAQTQRHALETTRTVLKNLFRKSGTRRQAELVARVLG